MFDYKIAEDNLSVEELLRNQWRLGKSSFMNCVWPKPSHWQMMS